MRLIETDIDDGGPFIATIVDLDKICDAVLEDDGMLHVRFVGSKRCVEYTGSAAKVIWNELCALIDKPLEVTEPAQG